MQKKVLIKCVMQVKTAKTVSRNYSWAPTAEQVQIKLGIPTRSKM